MFSTAPQIDTGKKIKGKTLYTIDRQYKEFKGILHHRNAKEKPCPGVLHRNRIYRGITEEWWMPCEMFGEQRNYYSGPFAMPVFEADGVQKPGFFQWKGTFPVDVDLPGVDPRKFRSEPEVWASTYKDADIEAIAEYKSYFDRNNQAAYYACCERLGGFYPLGMNGTWHGGVHFKPPEDNTIVYAAASGTIVAARIRSHDDTETHPDYGSQRFVLIRHTVRELGDAGRVDYKGTPKYVFSLYMHLERFEDPSAEHPLNPPWYNLCLRNGTVNGTDVNILKDEKGVVFHPDIEVSVGDVLGTAGRYQENVNCLHFEIFTLESDLKIDNHKTFPSKLVFSDDKDFDAYCDDKYVEEILKKHLNKTKDDWDPLTAARCFREAKTYHMSEWAVTSMEGLRKCYRQYLEKHPEKKDAIEKQVEEDWMHIRRFTWWEEACENKELKQQLGPGFAWYYHPITFMQCVNENIAFDYTAIPHLPPVKSASPPSVKLEIAFTGITQNPDAGYAIINGEELRYIIWVDGEYAGQVAKQAAIQGKSHPLDGSLRKEVSVPENRHLEIMVRCFTAGNPDEPWDRGTIAFSKKSAPPWGECPGTRYVHGEKGLFEVAFVIKILEEAV